MKDGQMYREKDVDILSRTLYGEARNEDRQGLIAVACTVLNRIKKRNMAGYEVIDGVKTPTIAETCLRKWQYSCWNKNDPNRKIIIQVSTATAGFVSCVEIALAAAKGELEDITKGATHYYNPKACPKPFWAEGKTPCVIIGRHLFFNDID